MEQDEEAQSAYDSSESERAAARSKKAARLKAGKSQLIHADEQEKEERRLNFIFSLALKIAMLLILLGAVTALLIFFF